MAYYQPDTEETDFTKPEEYKLYVANIPVELNEEGVKQIFNHYGKVIGLFYRPHTTWAFVTYETYREAEYALRDLHDKPPLYLKVSFGKEKTSDKMVQKKSHNQKSVESYEHLNQNPQCNNEAYEQITGKGKPINAFYKQRLQRFQLPAHRYHADDDLLYPVPTDLYTYDPYESVDPFNHANALWTRGTVTVTRDGKRHVSNGRGYTSYEIPDPHPEIETMINQVHEKRINGLYEHGQDALKHMVGKCICCAKVTKMKCERCYSFYCSRECQVVDWPRHKTECRKIPALIKDIKSLSTSSDEEHDVTLNLPRTYQNTLRRPKKSAEALLNKNAEATTNKCTDITNTKSSANKNFKNDHQINDTFKINNDTSKLSTTRKDIAKPKETLNTSDPLKVEKDLAFKKSTFLKKKQFTQVKIVEFATDGEYWIHKVDQAEVFQKMMCNLQDMAENMPKTKPVVGKMYAHKFEELWHRVNVMSINPTRIFFLDYGTINVIEDDDFREITLENIEPFTQKIRLSQKAQETHGNLKLNDIIFVKPISFEENVIIVDIQNKETSRSSLTKLLAAPQSDDAAKSTSELSQDTKEKKSVNKSKTVLLSLPSVTEFLSESSYGLLEVHAMLQNNTYGITLLPDNLSTEFQKILYELPEHCSSAKQDNEYKVSMGELVCGQRADGDWLRGCVLALQPIQLAIIDEARVTTVQKVIPYPDKFHNICKFGVICEIAANNCKLQANNHYNFHVVSCSNEVVIEIEVKEQKVKGVIKLWEPRLEQSGVKLFELKSGTEVCITSYRNQSTLYVRSLQPEDQEKFHKIMQDVAKCAQSAPYLEELPVVGEMVMAQYIDNNFYRAIVIKIHEEKQDVRISYVDFGNEENTFWTNLKVLPAALKLHPSCAAKVILKDVPTDAAMNEDTSNYLIDLTGREVPLICNFSGIPSKDGVSLTLANGESINDKIKQLLTPSWEKSQEEDTTVYMSKDIKSAELVSSDQNHVIVLSTIKEGMTYAMCPLDIDLMTNVYDVLPGLMSEYCVKANYYVPRKDELCLALYEDHWYRTVCISPSVTVKKCKLFFLDYGSVEEVPHENIRAMTKDFLTPASLSSVCNVVNLVPNSENAKIPSNILKRISELVSPGCRVLIKVVQTLDDGLYTVELPEVRDKLIEENLIPSS
ncbi:hypothetical protein KPH14_008956 [Odynerus spinipes]|uniref:Tudor domain-containing protein 1 n=1 Tax=Odynerus spinipes TaxID=1348599 RepID=A0AAD9RNA2_9HYME|nr:hypothetical protein KPH14_008956 [Odynerus spinipes]